MSKPETRRRGTTGSTARRADSPAGPPEITGHRHERLQQLLREEVGSLIGDEVTDPALEGVRIAAVLLSVDYKSARVHFTRIGVEPTADERERVAKALVRAAPFLRARLADSIDLKRVPDLRFIFDGATAAAEIAPDLPPSLEGDDPLDS